MPINTFRHRHHENSHVFISSEFSQVNLCNKTRRSKVYFYFSSSQCASRELLPFPRRGIYDSSNLSSPISRRFVVGSCCRPQVRRLELGLHTTFLQQNALQATRAQIRESYLHKAKRNIHFKILHM